MSTDNNVVSQNLAADKAVIEDAVGADSDGLTPLVGNNEAKAAGSFVLSGMPLATDQGFRNVAKVWYNKTISYEDGLDLLEKGKAQSEDILATVNEMIPVVKDSKFALLHRPSERWFYPTEHAAGQMGHWAQTGTWYVQHMMEQEVKDNLGKKTLYLRDEQDAETLATVFRNGFRRCDPAKKFLWRVRTDGSLRAMMTEIYAIVDNRWFLEQLQKLIPGGRLSHWKGDNDTIWGNVLIPDTIREEKDSDYGGMLSVSNCEIGTRRINSVPSIFRAICMNGCIWGSVAGKGIRKVHRGKIDLADLALSIKENLNKQIPLALQGIDKLLGTRLLAWDGAEAKVVIAAASREFKLSKKQASAVLTGYRQETNIVPDYAKTLFGLTNAVTRAGQTFDNPADWVKFDEFGGELMDYDKDSFDKLISRAKGLTVKEVDDCFAAVN